MTNPAKPDVSEASVRDLLCDWLAPIASDTVELDEDMIGSFPRDRLSILSIHQSKGLEFPLVIVDVGSDFKTNHRAHAFKRYPSQGGMSHTLEDMIRPLSGLGKPTRAAQDRAFDDLERLYYVAFTRAQQVLVLVGLDKVKPSNATIPNVASGWDRQGTRTGPAGPSPTCRENMTTITLGVREQPYEIPSYSLTGDILGYLRCGLQYRYTRLGKMPPRSPVQLWFGHFIHGCMDEGFRRYKAAVDAGKSHQLAMQDVDPDQIVAFVEERLLNQGIAAWEPWLKLLGYARARVALLELGPHLFPLISQSEIRLTGRGGLKPLPPGKAFRERTATRWQASSTS